jgi:hypothetical protein
MTLVFLNQKYSEVAYHNGLHGSMKVGEPSLNKTYHFNFIAFIRFNNIPMLSLQVMI